MTDKPYKDQEDKLLDGVDSMLKNWDKSCQNCKHLFRDSDVKNKCKAFPGGIPEPYKFGELQHTTTKLFGQETALVFEPLKQK